jgi:hypothetical protein
MADTSLMGET